jgi:UDPglucose 6-dehydrogenase
MNVTVIGAGYVGLTTGLALAYAGRRVCCLEADPEKVRALEAGRIPIHEPFAAEMLAAVGKRLRFTLDTAEALAGADVIYIAVGTPSGANGEADMRYVRAAAAAIGQYLPVDRYVVVINKSTVPIGSASLVEGLIRQAFAAHHGKRAKAQVGVASNPEFLREGSALADSLYPDRVVVGTDDPRAVERLKQLYKPFLDQSFAAPKFLPRPAAVKKVPMVITSVVSSELTKYAANAFLATKISFANEIAMLAEHCGADVEAVTRGIGLDHRIGPAFLKAGLGWGGSCFGKDTSALARAASDYGLEMHITNAARAANTRQRSQAVVKLQRELKILQGKTIGVLGLAFKPDTDDLRDSPAIDVARRLVERGARVRVHDPAAMERTQREHADLNVEYVKRAADLAEGADALVLATDWAEYARLPWGRLARKMRGALMVDGRNFLDQGTLERAGFRYVGFGR